MQTALLEKGAWKMSKWSTKVLSALAIMVVLTGSAVQAAIINISYANVQTATNVTFTSNVQNISPTGPINLATGTFIRFGIAVSVTNNANPEFGSDWVNAGGLAQPANLGLALINMQVHSTDPTGAALLARGTAGNPAISRAVFNPTYSWALTDPGTVAGGEVGTPSPINAGNAGVNATTPSGVAQLTYFAVTPDTLFTGLVYQVLSAAQSVTLTPEVVFGSTNVWSLTPGTVIDGEPGSPPSYTARPLSAAFGPEADVVNLPAPLVINAPEPGTLGLAGLALIGLVGRRRSK